MKLGIKVIQLLVQKARLENLEFRGHQGHKDVRVPKALLGTLVQWGPWVGKVSSYQKHAWRNVLLFKVLH